MSQGPGREPTAAGHTDHDVIQLLSASIGVDKARDCVTDAIRALGLKPTAVTRSDALAILEHLALQPGIVGVAARFAKSRVYLMWSS